MPSNASAREICYHPNAGVYQIVHGLERRTLVDLSASGGPTVAQQIATLINQGASDRRPGSLNPLTGLDAVYFLEALENI